MGRLFCNGRWALVMEGGSRGTRSCVLGARSESRNLGAAPESRVAHQGRDQRPCRETGEAHRLHAFGMPRPLEELRCHRGLEHHNAMTANE